MTIVASIVRLHIVAIGAMGAFTFGWALTGRYLPHIALLAAVDWFVVNLLNRIVDVVEDRENNVPGATEVHAHARLTLLTGTGLLIGSLLLTAWWWPEALWPRLAFHVLGFAYNWRLIPTPRGRRRLKELPFVKNVASACGFLLTCFAMPLTQAPLLSGITMTTVVVAMAFFFLFELSYEVLYDLRDIDGDRAANVMTWPVMFGARAASGIAIAQMTSSVAIAVIGYLAGVLPWHLTIMAAAPVIQLVVTVPRMPDRITSAVCIGLTWAGAFLLVAYHIWEVLGLPGSTRA